MNVPRHHPNIIVAWLHYFLLWSSCLFFPRTNIIFASSSSSSVPSSSSSSSTTTTGGMISNKKIELPSWLSHVNNDILNRQKDIAKEKHKKAIQTALDHYPTDTKPPSPITNGNHDNPSSDTTTTIKFDTYKTTAPGKLPDFHEELGSAPIFVTQTPLFSKDECQSVIQMAEDYYSSEQKEWPQLPSGQYYIQGFWIKDVPAVREWFTNMCRDRLFPLLQQQFPDFIDTPEDLVVDQAYLFKYIPQPGLRTEIHTDAGCLSFTFSLNPKEEYEGGGTWIEGLEVVSSSSDGSSSSQDDDNNNDCTIEMDVGQCTVRPGGIRHCGKPLTKGTRYIIGGFCMSKKRVETVRQLLTTDESVKEGKVSKESLEAAIHLNPEYDGAYPELAHHYEQLEGNKEQSITILKDCLRLANPQSSTANYYLGTHYYHQGTSLELARRHLETCLQIDPTDGDAMNTLAQIHARLGHSQQEEDLYRRIVITPGVSKRILSNAYCNLGTFVATPTSIDEEIHFYKKSLEYEPTNVAALQSLGSAYASQNSWKQAINYYQRAVPLEKDDTTCLTLLYKAATMQLRLEMKQQTTQSPPLDREGMMKRLGQLMGESNLQLLQNKKRETTATG